MKRWHQLAGTAGRMHTTGGPAGRAQGHSIPRQSHSARNHLPLAAQSPGKAPTCDCHTGRPEPPDGQGGGMAEGELCQAAARGGTCQHGEDGRLDPAPSIPFSDHDEPVAVPETTAIACGQRTDAPRWNGRSKRRLRSRLRKREPVQSGIQKILRPAADARYEKPASRGFYFEQRRLKRITRDGACRNRSRYSNYNQWPNHRAVYISRSTKKT